MNRWVYGLVVFAVVGGGIAATLGDHETSVDLSAPLEVWGNVVRDVNQLGLQLTRVSDDEEMKFGDRLASAIGHEDSSDEWTRYVGAVGESLVPHVRRQGIQYTFVVIHSPAINAFAMPGGHVAVTTGLLDFAQSEAELAAVLGHEIAHVDMRHCIERYQYRMQLQKIGLENSPVNALLDINQWLMVSAYTKYQEIEADEQGVRLSIQAGYDPEGGPAIMARLAAARREPGPTRARTPVQEAGRAVSNVLGSYFASHPRSRERSHRLTMLVERNRRRLTGREWYVGRENLRLKTPRSRQDFQSERRRI